MKANSRLDYLLKKYLDGDIDISLQDELFSIIAEEKLDESLLFSIEADLYLKEEDDSANLPPYVAEEIIRKIVKSEPAINQLIVAETRKLIYFKRIAIAALFIGVMVLGYFSLNYINRTENKFVEIIPQSFDLITNNTQNVQLVLLSDGSKVFLDPGSKLHFTRKFNGEQREVYLEGEAFFKVKKNPNKPFLVYYNNIVTKVLGTSFRVGTNKVNGQLVVEVATGRVQVSENSKLANSDKTISPVIVTPNQKVSYDQYIRRFETTIVSRPVPVIMNEDAPLEEIKSLFFEQQKLSVVFGQIEKYYLTEITVENSAIYNCVFTGDISNLDLFSALKIICIATNSEYEINGTKILIKGKGCN
jgi:hypothetical protein